ncbi:MAG: pilin [bacterium]|nr:pilin [bacterium]
MKRTKKIIVALAIFGLVLLPQLALAQATTDEFGLGGEFEGALGDKLTTDADLPEVIGRIINIVLGFLGIVAVVMIIIGGFIWMTAAGNEEKVEKAKQLLTAGLIGLVIILSAYAIASYVIGTISTEVLGG